MRHLHQEGWRERRREKKRGRKKEERREEGRKRHVYYGLGCKFSMPLFIGGGHGGKSKQSLGSNL